MSAQFGSTWLNWSSRPSGPTAQRMAVAVVEMERGWVRAATDRHVSTFSTRAGRPGRAAAQIDSVEGSALERSERSITTLCRPRQTTHRHRLPRHRARDLAVFRLPTNLPGRSAAPTSGQAGTANQSITALKFRL